MKKIAVGLVLILGLILVGCTQNGTLPTSKVTDVNKAIFYKSQTCGCCSVYAKYLEKEGLTTEIKTTTNMDAIKKQFNVPILMQSCHTIRIGDYFIEGHIPIEAINKLLNDKPNIAGIALGGMPSGTPGMPGPKTEDWVIYAIQHDGKQSVFMTI